MKTDDKERGNQSLTKQSRILITGQALAFSFNFLVPIIVVRYLDIEQYGVYKQLFLVVMTLTLILPMGIVESLYYFIPRERKHSRQYLMQTLIFLIIGGLIFLFIMFFFGRGALATLHLSHLSQYLIPLSLYIVFMSISLPFEKLLIIQEQVTYSSIITVISEVLKGICIISATILARDLLIMLYGLVLFSCLRVIVFSVYLKQNNLYLFSFEKADPDRTRKQVQYALPFGLSVGIATIRRFLNQYIVSFLFSTKDFAIYAVGSFQIPLMNVVFTSVSNVVLIRISDYQKQGKIRDMVRIWLNSARKLALIYLPVTVLFIMVSREFITVIFTERYLDSVPIFVIMLFQIPLDIFITHSILKAFAETKFIFKLNLAFLVVTALLLFIFIDLLGMIGAALATVCALASVRILEIIKVKKLLDISLSNLVPWKILLKILMISSASALLTFLTAQVLSLHSALQRLVFEAPLFISAYSFMVFHSGLLLQTEKEEFWRIVKKTGSIPLFKRQ